MTRLSRASILAAALIFGGVPAITAPALAADAIEIVAPAALSVDIDAQRHGTVGIVLTNHGTAPANVSIVIDVPGASGGPIFSVAPNGVTVPAGTSRSVELMLTRIGEAKTYSGYVLAATGDTSDAVPITIKSPAVPIAGLPGYVGLAALVLGALVFLFVLANPKVRSSLRLQVGHVGWDFDKSWATTLTAVGAILGTVAGGDLLPDESTLLSKAWVSGLTLLFGVLVVLAPFVFLAFATFAKDKDTGDMQANGIFWVFLVSAFLTVVAVYGELTTLAIMLVDGLANGSPLGAGLPLIAIAVVSAFVVGAYVVRSIGWIANSFVERQTFQDSDGNLTTRDVSATPRVTAL